MTFELLLDPWDIEYGAEFKFSTAVPAVEDVDVEVESAADRWTARPACDGPAPEQLYFVDGVRRLEAKLLARRGDVLCHGAFGSCAVGCVDMQPVPIVCEDAVHRVIALGAGQSLDAPVAVSPALSYEPASTASIDPDGPLLALQERMRTAEEQLGRRLADRPGALVVSDGPLTFNSPVRGAAVGFIKRLHELYLPPPQRRLLSELKAAERTPLFAIRASQRFSRYAWFLRLAPAGPADFDLAGLARLEVWDGVGVDAAVALADMTARVLPGLAPSRWRDPRSPQNLMPIGALESALRRRMGDARLVRRHIESYLIGTRK